ncbi:integrase core domain-containing protein, partial [Escherichia coli]
VSWHHYLKLKGLTPIEYRNQTYMPRV